MEQSKKTKRALATIAEYQAIFGSPTGKNVLWDIMKEGNMIRTSFVSGAADPYELAFNEGRRSMVLHVLKKIGTNLAKLEEQLKEGEEYERSSYE